MKKAKLSHQEKELPMSSENSEANCLLTVNVMKQSWKKRTMRLKTSKCWCWRDERNSWVHDGRVAGCHSQTQKKGKAGDSNESEPETSKLATRRQNKWWGRSSTKSPQQRGCTPEAWRRKRIKVTYKKGDVEEAGNYRPICTLPALYKLFSTLLYNRTVPEAWPRTSRQPGWISTHIPNSGSSCNIQIVRTEMQGVAEIKMWTATVDFAKALDTIKHKALWTALAQFGVESHQSSLLKRLHADQKATVLTDTGELCVDLLWCSTRFCRLHWKTIWHDGARKAWGISLCVLESDCLSNLRFAGRRAVTLYFPGTAQKFDVRQQERYRKCRTENPLGKDENS